MPKFFVVAGEASGDLHASELVLALKAKFPTAEFKGWAGEKCAFAGMQVTKHYKEISMMGFVGVLLNFRKFQKLINQCAEEIKSYRPDAVIFTDFSGFNVRVAQKVRGLTHKQIYFIAPKVWAWNTRRVRKFPSLFDLMLLILPFEEEFFKQAGCNAVYIGNPSLAEISHWQQLNPKVNIAETDKPLIALLPGSRASEIKHNLPIMAGFALQHSDKFRFEVAAVEAHSKEHYEGFMQGAPLKLSYGKTWELLQNARGAIVVSGTATLETALLGTPLVLVYKTSWLNYRIAKKLIKVKYLGLCNLILNRLVIPELIQDDFTIANLNKKALPLFEQGAQREAQLMGFEDLKKAFGNFKAPEKGAEVIAQLLEKK